MNVEKQMPFREKSLHCPACGKRTTVIYLPGETSRLYQAEHHEPDRHVESWKWKNPLWADLNPYHYALWFCPLCYYVDFEQDFKHDHSNTKNKITNLKPLILNDKEKDNSVINFLGKDIDYNNMTPAMAIKIFLLAIYIQELIKDLKKDDEYHLNRDWNKLARLYLRLAWLYRENKSDSAKTGKDAKFTAIDDSLTELRTSIAATKNKIQTCKELITGSLSEAEGGMLDKIFAAETQTIENLEKLSLTLNGTVTKIKTEMNGADTSSAEEQEIKELMVTLSALWPEAIFDEAKAVRKAIEFYSLTADNDTNLTPMGAFNIAEFTATLWQMLDRKNEALTVLTEIVRRASNERTKIMRKLSSTKSMVDKLKVEENLKKMNAYIQETSYKTKEIKDELKKSENNV